MKRLAMLAVLIMIAAGGYSQTVRKARVRTGGNTTIQNQPSLTKENMPDKNPMPVLRPQNLIPVEISGSQKTMLKSDYMTFCNIPFNLDVTEFEKKLEDADFEYEDEQTEDLFLEGYGNVDVYSGIFPAMAVTAYIHYSKVKKVYRVELQTKLNSDDNTRAMFNNWHKRLQVYVDGGEGDNVEDPIAFSKSGPEMYYITFFPGDNCTADVKGWIILRIVYKDKTDADYDENHSSFVTVDYIDAQTIPADVKAAWGF
ncbi:MAG: hypothetical protein J6T04_08505 [Bacteroidales bacterium]|nr:hypothetical protein [Bacteroidales bacterium]